MTIYLEHMNSEMWNFLKYETYLPAKGNTEKKIQI